MYPKHELENVPAIFWSRADKTGGLGAHRWNGSSCWTWTMKLRPNGYAGFEMFGIGFLAHRLAYELAVGPIPYGLTIDHLCRNRACVNPDHLEPVTLPENNRRGYSMSAINARKDTCKYGHPFDKSNTAYWSNGKQGICRNCLTCHRSQEALRRSKRQAALEALQASASALKARQAR